MKTKPFLPILLLAAGTLAGCGGEPAPAGDSSKGSGASAASQTSLTSYAPLPQEYSLMQYWAGNPGEDCYRVIEKEDETVIRYEDVTGEASRGWEYVSLTSRGEGARSDRFCLESFFSALISCGP